MGLVSVSSRMARCSSPALHASRLADCAANATGTACTLGVTVTLTNPASIG